MSPIGLILLHPMGSTVRPRKRMPRGCKVVRWKPWPSGRGGFHQYREMAPSFPNEGGGLGPPSLPTLEKCLQAGQRHLHSFA